jgi:transposase
MEKIDGRRIGAAAREERKRTILRMKRAGFRTGAVITAAGCTRQQISALWIAYNNFKGKNAEEAVSRNKQTGRKKGEGRTLNIRQEEAVQKIITEKYPDQLKFDFALWTREAVQKLIEKKYGILMPIRTAGEYLRRWGFTPQKPAKYAYERDAEKVKEWKEKEYKAIRKRAKRVKAEIYWGDETTIKAGDVRGRGYAPAGKTPVVNRTEKKENVSMISAITNQGKVHWKLYEGSINGDRVIEFVKRLIKTAERKEFLITDNAKTRHSKKLKERAEESQQPPPKVGA